MAKKSKKKTVASTRPHPPEKKQPTPQGKKRKTLKSLLIKAGKKTTKSKSQEQKTAKELPVEKASTESARIPAEKSSLSDSSTISGQKITAKPGQARVKIFAEHRQKIKGGILAMIGIFSLCFIGWFLFGKMFRPQYLAEILPASQTLAVVEINTDGAASQPQQFYRLMSKYPVYSKDGLVKLLTYLMPLDFAKDVEPWLGRRVGMAVVKSAQTGQMDRIYFVESRDHNMTLEFMRSRALRAANEEMISKDFKGYKVYAYPISHLFEFTFINNYLVLAENNSAMENLLNSIAAGGQKLADDPDYAKASNNLAQGGLIFAYADFSRIYDTLSLNEDFMTRKGQDFNAFKPFLAIFKSAGLTVFAEQNRFTLQSLTNLDKKIINDGGYLTFSEKYTGNLLHIANEEPVLLAGGHDLRKELSRVRELFSGGTKTSDMVFEGILEAQKQLYFGKDISLEGDIYPLLAGEYLFTVDNSLENPQFSLILELLDKDKDLPRFEKIVAAFKNTGGIFMPKIQTVTLPDGTTGQEIVASPEQIESSQENYEDLTLNILKLGNTGWSVYYAAVGDKIILSTNKDLIKHMIDRAEGRIEKSLVNTPFYDNVLNPAMRTADEIFNIKIGALTEALGLNANENLKPYLLPFANLAVSRNYFTDGISTIYYLQVI
jgi:hypothetical protein